MKRLRKGHLGAVGIAAALGLSGCTSSPGAAALVGDSRISVDTLQAAVNRALADPQLAQLASDRVGFARQELARLIEDRVVAAAARARGITATPAEVDRTIQQFTQQAGGRPALLQQAAQSGIAASELPRVVYSFVLQQKLGDQLVANVQVSDAQLQQAYQQNIDQYDQVRASQILVKSKPLAQRLLATVRAHPDRFATLAKRFSLDTSTASRGGDLGFQGRSGYNDPAFAAAVFRAKVGAPFVVHTQLGYEVVRVLAHRRQPLAQVTDQLRQQVLAGMRSQLIGDALKAEAARLGVHVSPRYGVWNADKGAVDPLPGTDQLSVPATAAAAPPGSG